MSEILHNTVSNVSPEVLKIFWHFFLQVFIFVKVSGLMHVANCKNWKFDEFD